LAAALSFGFLVVVNMSDNIELTPSPLSIDNNSSMYPVSFFRRQFRLRKKAEELCKLPNFAKIGLKIGP
jgi:hypothetical protein